MKRETTMSIAVALSVLLLPAGLGQMAQGQQVQKRYQAGTGLFRLGENQSLSLTLIGGEGDDTFHTRDGEPDAIVHTEVTTITYALGDCPGDNVCKLRMTSQNRSDISLMPGEAISKRIDYDPSVAVFSINFSSNSRNVQAIAFIVDSVTGKVVTRWELILLDLAGFNRTWHAPARRRSAWLSLQA